MPVLARVTKKKGKVRAIALSHVVEPQMSEARASSRVRRNRSKSSPHRG